MALDVKYLRGTSAQYEAYAADSKLVDYYYYLITNTDGSIDLYIGKVKLSNNADLVAAVASIGKRIDDVVGLNEALDDRVESLETDVAYLKENAGHKFYEVTALPAFAEGHTYKEGDVCIVTVTKDGVDYKTAYHCIKNAEGAFAWAAMAGNYNAANVYYDKNIQVTKTVGNVETSNNKPVDLQFKGKNMEQIWQYLYATEDKTLSITQPKATFSVSSSVDKEVGNVFSDPVCSITFADGSYEYGSKDADGNVYADGVNEAAGVKFNNAVIKLSYDNGTTKDETLATKTDSSNTKFEKTYTIPANADNTENVVTETTRTWKFKATASCPASSRYPVTNLGNFIDKDGNTTTVIANATKNTAAQTATNLGEKTFSVSGYRACFWGYKTSKAITPASITSAQVRALGNGPSKTLNATITKSLDKMQQIFIAAPKGKYTTVTVTNTDLGAPQTVKKVTDIMVEGYDGYTAAAYDVFYVDNDNADSKAYNYKITIA